MQSGERILVLMDFESSYGVLIVAYALFYSSTPEISVLMISVGR